MGWGKENFGFLGLGLAFWTVFGSVPDLPDRSGSWSGSRTGSPGVIRVRYNFKSWYWGVIYCLCGSISVVFALYGRSGKSPVTSSDVIISMRNFFENVDKGPR